jgi:Tfp pilus assembly protein PilO
MFGNATLGAALVVILLGGILIAVVIAVWTLAFWRRGKAALSGDKNYRRLAEEYRTLAETAVNGRERTDLKIEDLAMRIDQMRDQLESVQRILKDVE